MPDYDYNIMLGDNVLSINASVRGETIRRLSYISSAFPADFMTPSSLASRWARSSIGCATRCSKSSFSRRRRPSFSTPPEKFSRA